jgi:YD repeat-containing protein
VTTVVDQQGNVAPYTYDATGHLLRIDRVNADGIFGPLGITLALPKRGKVGALPRYPMKRLRIGAPRMLGAGLLMVIVGALASGPTSQGTSPAPRGVGLHAAADGRLLLAEGSTQDGPMDLAEIVGYGRAMVAAALSQPRSAGRHGHTPAGWCPGKSREEADGPGTAATGTSGGAHAVAGRAATEDEAARRAGGRAGGGEVMGQNSGKWLEEALVAGPILGWRLWRTTPDGTLMSVYKDVFWRAGTPLRANPRNRGEGVYALKDRTKLDGHGYTLTADQSGMVVGQVALWGTVIEHELGYRAQYAYPALIDLAPPMPGFPRPASLLRLAKAIRDRYGCEVTV